MLHITFVSQFLLYVTSQIVYSNWALLCDKIDDTLQPAKQTKRRSLIFIIILLFFVVALILIGFVSTNNSIAFMICYLTAFVALIVGLIFVFCRVSFVQRRIEKEIQKVCDDATEEYTGIRFEVKRDKHIYIDIIILNTTSVPNYIPKVGDDTLTQSLLADGDRVDSV